jgi:glycine cleavage system H protein
MDLAKLRYLPSHEWADIQGDVCTMGITQYAVDQLTDVTNLEPGKIGKQIVAGKPFGEIESVKAVFDLNAPVTGEIVEINDAVLKDHSIINSDPYGKGWMIRVKVAPGAASGPLLTYEQYQQQIASEGH